MEKYRNPRATEGESIFTSDDKQYFWEIIYHIYFTSFIFRSPQKTCFYLKLFSLIFQSLPEDIFNFKGKVNLKNPDNTFGLLEYYGACGTQPSQKPYQIYFGRWVKHYLFIPYSNMMSSFRFANKQAIYWMAKSY